MRASFGCISKKISVFSGVAVLLFSFVFGLSPQAAHAIQGNFTRYPLPVTSSPIYLTTGPDGAIWATELTNKVARITADGQTSEIEIDDLSNGILLLAGITTGSDGNLWVAEQSGNNIDRITPDGIVTRFTNDFGSAVGIVNGPDGNLWFASDTGVGMMTTSGVMTSYIFPLDVNGDSPGNYDIAVGPDGNLWVAELGTGKIGKVTTSGVITEYDIPTPNSTPRSIATGPDGNMWFTSYSTGIVGKISMSGVITEYTLPSGFSSPMSITRGFGQDLWVIGDGGELAKILLDGTAVVLPTSSPITAEHMTTGSDGNLWFADGDYLNGGTDSVSKMVIDNTPPVVTATATIQQDATTLSGTVNEPGSTLVLTLPGGSTITATADNDGHFTFTIPAGSLNVGDVLSIGATDLSDNTTVAPFQVTVAAVVSAPTSPSSGSGGTLANTGTALIPIIAAAMTMMIVPTAWIIRGNMKARSN